MNNMHDYNFYKECVDYVLHGNNITLIVMNISQINFEDHI